MFFQAVEVAQSVADYKVEKITALAATIRDVSSHAALLLKELAEKKYAISKAAIEDVVEYKVEKLQYVTDKIVSLTDILFGDLVDFTKMILENTKMIIADAVDAKLELVGKVADAKIEFVGDVVEAKVAAVEAVGDGFYAVGKAKVEGIKNVGEAAVDAVTNTAKVIGEQALGLYGFVNEKVANLLCSIFTCQARRSESRSLIDSEFELVDPKTGKVVGVLSTNREIIF